MQKDLIWALSNLCCGCTQSHSKAPCIPLFFRALELFEDEETTRDSLWALSYILKDSSFDWLEHKIHVLQKVLESWNWLVLVPCLRIVADVTAADEAYSDVIKSNLTHF